MYISIDLGGTKTRVASTEDLKNITEENIFMTDQRFNVEKEHILYAISDVINDGEIKGICLGVPGLVDKKNKRMKKIVNVHSLSNLTFSEIFDNRFSEDIIFAENDAALAGLGEAVLGSGKGYDVVAYITLSTGVGGVRVSGQRLDPNQKFFEPGHMVINASEEVFSPCGQSGCLSYYVSGKGFELHYGESPVDCDNRDHWNDYAKNLSIGLVNIIALWAPDIIVLGGSMTKSFDAYFKDPLMDQLKKETLFEIPPIVKASLGDNAGIYGGFVYLSQVME